MSEQVILPTIPTPPIAWIKRRARVSNATAKLLAELAFAQRVRALGDQGATLDAMEACR